jgi:hypothetical protein
MSRIKLTILATLVAVLVAISAGGATGAAAASIGEAPPSPHAIQQQQAQPQEPPAWKKAWNWFSGVVEDTAAVIVELPGALVEQAGVLVDTVKELPGALPHLPGVIAETFTSGEAWDSAQGAMESALQVVTLGAYEPSGAPAYGHKDAYELGSYPGMVSGGALLILSFLFVAGRAPTIARWLNAAERRLVTVARRFFGWLCGLGELAPMILIRLVQSLQFLIQAAAMGLRFFVYEVLFQLIKWSPVLIPLFARLWRWMRTFLDRGARPLGRLPGGRAAAGAGLAGLAAVGTIGGLLLTGGEAQSSYAATPGPALEVEVRPLGTAFTGSLTWPDCTQAGIDPCAPGSAFAAEIRPLTGPNWIAQSRPPFKADPPWRQVKISDDGQVLLIDNDFDGLPDEYYTAGGEHGTGNAVDILIRLIQLQPGLGLSDFFIPGPAPANQPAEQPGPRLHFVVPMPPPLVEDICGAFNPGYPRDPDTCLPAETPCAGEDCEGGLPPGFRGEGLKAADRPEKCVPGPCEGSEAPCDDDCPAPGPPSGCGGGSCEEPRACADTCDAPAPAAAPGEWVILEGGAVRVRDADGNGALDEVHVDLDRDGEVDAGEPHHTGAGGVQVVPADAKNPETWVYVDVDGDGYVETRYALYWEGGVLKYRTDRAPFQAAEPAPAPEGAPAPATEEASATRPGDGASPAPTTPAETGASDLGPVGPAPGPEPTEDHRGEAQPGDRADDTAGTDQPAPADPTRKPADTVDTKPAGETPTR